jgi:hypothetical protein
MENSLNIEIVNKNGILANCLFEDGAPTEDAIILTEDCLRAREENLATNDSIDDKLLAVMMLEKIGCVLNSESAKEMIALYPDESFSNVEILENGIIICYTSAKYCYGVISTTKEGIARTKKEAYDSVIINIDSKTIDFRATVAYDDAFLIGNELCLEFTDTYEKILEKLADYKKNIPSITVPFSLSFVPFDWFRCPVSDLSKFYRKVVRCDENNSYFIVNDTIYAKIYA